MLICFYYSKFNSQAFMDSPVCSRNNTHRLSWLERVSGKKQIFNVYDLIEKCLTGLAGFVVALTRILTKLVIANERVSTFFFLLMSVCYIAASYAFHSITIQSPFVRYHTKQCAKIVLRPDEDRVLVNTTLNHCYRRYCNKRFQFSSLIAIHPLQNMVYYRWTRPDHHRYRQIRWPPKRPVLVSVILCTSYQIRVLARAHWTVSTIFQTQCQS